MKKRIFKSEGHLTITEEKTQGELIIGGVRRGGSNDGHIENAVVQLFSPSQGRIIQQWLKKDEVNAVIASLSEIAGKMKNG